MAKKRLLGWAGGLAGVPLLTAVYRRLGARRTARSEERLYVRTTVEPELVSDLVDLVRRVNGRATVEGRDSFSVPVPDGVREEVAYRELRALLGSWTLRHPGVSAEIVASRSSLPGSDPLKRPRLGATKRPGRTKSV